MATIGHTLVGLSLSNVPREQSQPRRLFYVWPGLMILLAHLVDIVEWGVVLVTGAHVEQHMVTNSPLLTGLITLIVCAAIALITKLRRPWIYVLIVVAIFSHLLLDSALAKATLLDTYNPPSDEEMPSLWLNMEGEIWFYGLFLTLMSLIRATRQRDCPRAGRAVAGVLAALAVFAAIRRNPLLWAPAYTLAALHSILLLRRGVRVRLAWNLIPLVPLLTLVAAELWAGQLHKEGMSFYKDKNYATAEEMFQRATTIPTRSAGLSSYPYLIKCQRRRGDFAAADETLREALKIGRESECFQFQMAFVCIEPQVRNTPYLRVSNAVLLFNRIIQNPAGERYKRYARYHLEKMKKDGLIE